MKNTLSSLIKFALLFLLLLSVIVVLNWIPRLSDKGGMKHYDSIEKLKDTPAFDRVLVPKYFHKSVTWPPTLVMGMWRPFISAVMIFSGTAGDEMLVISESTSEKFRPNRVTDFAELRQSIEIDLNGRNATLETGLCHGGQSCSRVIWQEGELYVTVFMRAPSVTLLRIAESML